MMPFGLNIVPLGFTKLGSSGPYSPACLGTVLPRLISGFSISSLPILAKHEQEGHQLEPVVIGTRIVDVRPHPLRPVSAIHQYLSVIKHDILFGPILVFHALASISVDAVSFHWWSLSLPSSMGSSVKQLASFVSFFPLLFCHCNQVCRAMEFLLHSYLSLFGVTCFLKSQVYLWAVWLNNGVRLCLCNACWTPLESQDFAFCRDRLLGRWSPQIAHLSLYSFDFYQFSWLLCIKCSQEFLT